MSLRSALKSFVDWRKWLLLALALGGIEIVLRCVWQPGRDTVSGWRSAPYNCSNLYWGVWHFPTAEVEHAAVCFRVRYRTNRLGMRSRELEGDNRPRILLLGDSFVEGYGVNDDETMAARLEQKLGGRYHVINLGCSGGVGTIHETALYENLGRHLKAKIVVLCFLNYNDLYDNNRAERQGLINRELQPAYPVAAGFAEIADYTGRCAPGEAALRTVGSQQPVRLILFVQTVGKVLDAWWQLKRQVRMDTEDALAAVYLPERDESVERGWLIAGNSLQRLAQLTRADGVTLVVASLPDPYQTDGKWVRMMSDRSGKPLDAHLPNRRLEALCRKAGLDHHYDMLEPALALMKERQIGYPYLSLPCNRHYSPLGHDLVADLLATYLQEEGLSTAR